MSPLSSTEKVAAFKAATRGFALRYATEIAKDMTDGEIADALQRCLGTFSHTGGPNELSITCQGADLKIWASREVHNHVTMKPTWQGKAAIAMARETYGIMDPLDDQLPLL